MKTGEIANRIASYRAYVPIMLNAMKTGSFSKIIYKKHAQMPEALSGGSLENAPISEKTMEEDLKVLNKIKATGLFLIEMHNKDYASIAKSLAELEQKAENKK